jgi:hypothetical protein
VRVVDIGGGRYEQRKAALNEVEHAWVFAAKRHLDWLEAHLAR